MNSTVMILIRLLVSLNILIFLFVIYQTFSLYDWGHPLTKLKCFGLLFIVIGGSQFLKIRREVSNFALWTEAIVLTVVLIVITSVYINDFRSVSLIPPKRDIGSTTVQAVHLLVFEHQNPYSSSNINVRTDLDPAYRGFHYGPLMMAGYFPSAFSPGKGYKLMSIFYILVCFGLLYFLCIEPGEPSAKRMADLAFVISACLVGKVFWYENLYAGANDIFPVTLILASLLAVKTDRAFWAGFFAGLSFTAKFAPAIFLMPFLPIRQKRFWAGLAFGLTPLVPFIIWDFAGLFRNTFWLRVIIPADSTSLYSILPSNYHWLLGATLLISIFISLYLSLTRVLGYRSVLTYFTLLLIIADVTQKEIHNNHLIWFAPLFALLFSYIREGLNDFFSAPFRSPEISQT